MSIKKASQNTGKQAEANFQKGGGDLGKQAGRANSVGRGQSHGGRRACVICEIVKSWKPKIAKS